MGLTADQGRERIAHTFVIRILDALEGSGFVIHDRDGAELSTTLRVRPPWRGSA
jgi:hypothetical protein